jgi:hypothetical protein
MRSANEDSVDRVVDAVRSGSSAALVVRGDSALAWPAEFRVTHASGAEPDANLRGAGVHQLCAQLLDQVELLSASQREVLRSAFDPSAPEPDPSSLALTVFALLAGAGASEPVVCLVQDFHWLDALSRQALAFTARRLMTESVALLFIINGADLPRELAGLPELRAAEDRRVDAVTAG